MTITALLPPVAQRAAFALDIAYQLGIYPTLTSGFRSFAKQEQLRAQYLACVNRGERVYPGNPDAACRYPANAPGDSAHEFGLAFDSSVPAEQMADWTAIREAVGFRVPPNDPVHAEVPDWRTVAAALILAGIADAPPTISRVGSPQVAPGTTIAPPARVTPTPTAPAAVAGQPAAARPQMWTTATPGSAMCAYAVRTHPGYDVWCNGVKQG